MEAAMENTWSNSVFDGVEISLAFCKPFVEKRKEFFHVLIGQLLAFKATDCCLAKRPSEYFFHWSCQIGLCKSQFNAYISDFVNKGVNIVGAIPHVRISQRSTFWWFCFQLSLRPCFECFDTLIVKILRIQVVHGFWRPTGVIHQVSDRAWRTVIIWIWTVIISGEWWTSRNFLKWRI